MIDQTYNIPLFEEQFEEAARIMIKRIQDRPEILIHTNNNGDTFELIKDNSGDYSIVISQFRLSQKELCPCNSNKKYKHCHGKN